MNNLRIRPQTSSTLTCKEDRGKISIWLLFPNTRLVWTHTGPAWLNSVRAVTVLHRFYSRHTAWRVESLWISVASKTLRRTGGSWSWVLSPGQSSSWLTPPSSRRWKSSRSRSRSMFWRKNPSQNLQSSAAPWSCKYKTQHEVWSDGVHHCDELQTGDYLI